MQRRKGNGPYDVGAGLTMGKASTHGSFEMLSRLRNSEKTNKILDMRVDMHERATRSSTAKSILGVSKAPLLPSKFSKNTNSSSTGIAYQSSLALMMPSATPNGLKRCQSASMIRKRLQHAMDLSMQSSHDQVAALRGLSAAATVKPTPKSLLLNQRGLGGHTPSSSSSIPAPTDSNNLAYGNQLGGHTKSTYATMFADSTATCGSTKRPSNAATKVNTIELDVQLAERLNEIEHAKLSESAESWFRATQRAFDQVIQQDEAFGRVLASIRDEYHAYIAFLTHSNQTALATPACPCRRKQQSDNQRNDQGDDVTLARQEHPMLTKSCSSLQREIEVLQASVLVASIQRGTPKSHCGKGFPSQPEDEATSDDDNELSDVSLLPLDDADRCHRPAIIPPLDFSCLSPYNEEEEEESDQADEEF